MPGFQVEQQTSPVSKHSWGPLAALRASAAANQRRPRSNAWSQQPLLETLGAWEAPNIEKHGGTSP